MNDMKNDSSEKFWKCSGRGEDWPVKEQRWHMEETIYLDKCPKCEKPRPKLKPPLPKPPSDSSQDQNTSTESQSEKNWLQDLIGAQSGKDRTLLVALTILNLGSGFTTIYGAAQILPRLVGVTTGAAVQALLFLLVSGSTLKHSPRLKWLAVGSFSIISIYTSFFAYYDFLTASKAKQDSLSRATSAHQNLVQEVFAPIKGQAEQLEGEIKSKDNQIQQEIAGKRRSGLEGCGQTCKDLKDEREALQVNLDQISPVVNRLEPLFQYNLQGKTAQSIFETDLKALAEVQQNCLPSKPEFVCLPEKYVGSLDPNNPKYNALRSTYIDPEGEIGLLSPFLKIRHGEPPAIAAAIMALLVDGCIILLGAGIEVRQRPQTWPMQLKKGTGSEFLDELLEAIDSSEMTINSRFLQRNENGREYLSLLRNISANTGWIYKSDEEQLWQIVSTEAEQKLVKWLTEERARQVRIELDSKQIKSSVAKGNNVATLHLPSRDD
jgi:hypothetical protein